MATTDTVGQTLPLSIQYLDQHGQPMQTVPTPDAPPSWSNTTPATETLTVAADGLTATALAVAAGTDTINLSLAVGGQTFTASLAVTVAAQPQVLTSIEVVASAPTGP